MLTRIMKPRDDRDAGFTLIELLVVVAIIGILAAIAIPVFLSQRQGARDASVKADLNGIAKVMETIYTSGGAYPTVFTSDPAATPPVVGLDSETPVSSPGNYLYIETSEDGKGFQILGCNAESSNVFKYGSTTGGLVATAVDDAYLCSDNIDPGVVLTVDDGSGDPNIPMDTVATIDDFSTAIP